MPEIPQQSVRGAGRPGAPVSVRLPGRATPDVSGEAAAAAGRAVATGVQQLGQGVQQLASGVQRFQEGRDRDDAQEAYLKASEDLTAAENKWRSENQGFNGRDNLDGLKKAMDEVHQRYGAELSGGARAQFDQQMLRRTSSMAQSNLTWSANEVEKARVQNAAAIQQQGVSQAGANPYDPTQTSGGIQLAAGTARAEAKRQGGSVEAVDLAGRVATTQAVGAAIDSALNNNDPDLARDYLEKYADRMVQDQADNIAVRILDQSRNVQAQKSADAIFIENRPASMLDAPFKEEQAMEAASRIEDVQLRQRTEDRIRAKYRDYNRMQADQLSAKTVAFTEALNNAPSADAMEDLIDKAPVEIRSDLRRKRDAIVGQRERNAAEMQKLREAAIKQGAPAAKAQVKQAVDDGILQRQEDLDLVVGGLPAKDQEELNEYFRQEGRQGQLKITTVSKALEFVHGEEADPETVQTYYDRVLGFIPPGKDVTEENVIDAIRNLDRAGEVVSRDERGQETSREAMTFMEAHQAGLDPMWLPTFEDQEPTGGLFNSATFGAVNALFGDGVTDNPDLEQVRTRMAAEAKNLRTRAIVAEQQGDEKRAAELNRQAAIWEGDTMVEIKDTDLEALFVRTQEMGLPPIGMTVEQFRAARVENLRARTVDPAQAAAQASANAATRTAAQAEQKAFTDLAAGATATTLAGFQMNTPNGVLTGTNAARANMDLALTMSANGQVPVPTWMQETLVRMGEWGRFVERKPLSLQAQRDYIRNMGNILLNAGEE